jgi:large subunit ribosomal protein L14
MIQSGTKVVVADNTGAKVAECIMVLGKGRQRFATVGDRIMVAVKSAATDGSVKKGDMSKAVVVRTKKEVKRSFGEYIRFGDNAVVLINDGGDPKGTRVFGPVARELKKCNYPKIVSSAKEVL